MTRRERECTSTMMGGHHAACGAAAWVAGCSAAPFALGLHPVSPIGVVTGALVCAGAALLPDADHHDATIAHSLPPVSGWTARAVGRLSGGHRHGTHSILGVAVFTALAWLAGLVRVETSAVGTIDVGAGVVTIMLAAFALNALKLTRGTVTPWLVSLAIAVLIALEAPEEWNWMPVAVGLGTAVHLLGDMLTNGGVPLFWPLRARSPRWVRHTAGIRGIWRPAGNIAVPLLGRAGSWREWLLCVPVSVYALAGVGWAITKIVHGSTS